MTMVILRSEKPGDRTLHERRRAISQAIEWQLRIGPSQWVPPSDLFETDSSYVVRVEIAGMHDQDIAISIEGDLLVISGKRTDTPERRAFHQMAIRFGEFTVPVMLPGPVDEESASAAYEDGFLFVILPKV
jgi:HSP20 family molecular chaperone IbpA